MPEKYSYSEERHKIGCNILFAFISLLLLMALQFVLHHSETKDLQRRVGALEQQRRP